MEQQIDLNTCNPGDVIISRHGVEMEYVGRTPMHGLTYLDHVIRYVKRADGTPFPAKSYGTRTNDGYVFKNKRLPEVDHDVVQIIRK